jgi:hypothetical protein
MWPFKRKILFRYGEKIIKVKILIERDGNYCLGFKGGSWMWVPISHPWIVKEKWDNIILFPVPKRT